MLISSSVLSWSFSLSFLRRKFRIVLRWVPIVFLCIPLFSFHFQSCFWFASLDHTWSLFIFQTQSQPGPLLERRILLCLVDFVFFIGVCVRLRMFLLLLFRPLLVLLLPLAISSGVLYCFLSFLVFWSLTLTSAKCCHCLGRLSFQVFTQGTLPLIFLIKVYFCNQVTYQRDNSGSMDCPFIIILHLSKF